MVKLNRFTMPVFAGNAAQTQTSVFGTMKTSPQYTTDVAASIGTTAYGNGWADAIDLGYAPFMEDMNTLQRAITYQIAYNQQQGIPEWDANTEYYKGSLAKYNTANGSQVYSSLIDNNVGNLVSDATKWKLVFDTQNSYVTTNTTQTITGTKTFTQNITRENANLTKGTNPSSTSWTSIEFTDKNGSGTANRSGTIETTIYTSGNVMTALSAFKWVANSTDYARIAVYYPASGEPYTEAPTPTATTSTSSQQIATAGWVNSTGNNVVHLSGTETITGAKTFTYSPTMSFSGNYARGYRIENTNITRGTAPSDYVKWEFTAQDSTSANAEGRLGSFEVMYRPDGAIVSSMRAFQPAASTTQNPYTDAYIQLIYPASGNPYTTAPASDTANSIVTTVAKSKAANGYFQFGNGMIIQWGKLASTSSSITFPKAFSNTNYAISIFALTDTQDTQKTIHSIANGKTTTGISWLKVGQHDSPADNQSGYTHNWIAIGY